MCGEYTKAELLKYIKENMDDINILPMLIIESDSYFQNKEEIIDSIINFSKESEIIVRSSSNMEDRTEYSNAGAYESILNVKPDARDINEAICRVYDSYDVKDNQQILIQPMLNGITKSGVVFTSDFETLEKYYTINYQDGDDSTAVTSGKNKTIRTYVRYKDCSFDYKDKSMELLIKECKKIEEFLHNDALDIEFAITNENKVFIFQVRPIAMKINHTEDSIDISISLNRIYKKVSKLMSVHPFLLGQKTCFGVMPDWNPAEILGVRPKKLAISLYKELITDNIWAHQRSDYGYRDLTMHPLMVSFCGIPYIDTRITFNSFIPKSLDGSLAEKLVNYYLDKLEKYPKYHDKVEFEIVYSCYYIGLHDELKQLSNEGFSKSDIEKIEKSLLELTNKIIDPQDGIYKKDLLKINDLEKSFQKVQVSNISLVDKIYFLMEVCKEYGTLPFAGIARSAFIAVQFMKSFVNSEIISQDDYDGYMNSLVTVNKKMSLDLRKVVLGELCKDEFIERYGHIRPGTYDIMSKRYDEAFDSYFSQYDGLTENEDDNFSFSQIQIEGIQRELDKNKITTSAEKLLDFIKEAIEGREYLKFEFTKIVSEILKLIEELGVRVNIKKEDMAFADISIVKQLYSDLYTGNIEDIFRDNITKNKLQFEHAKRIKLPSLIMNPSDIYEYYMLDEEPNYITRKVITAQVTNIEDGDFEGKIVCVQAADPGYDFLFAKKIAGLITQFGGANSHMAIRCAELGIPAIIGVGEQNYNVLSKAKIVTIDAQKNQYIKIQ